MGVHRFERLQIIPASLEECWEFFAHPKNLAHITPPELGFEVRSNVPEAIYPGLMIEYRVRPLFGIPLPWLTEITHVSAPHSFVDEQRRGPYALWHHEHHFRQSEPGRVEMRDVVHYVLPFSPLSEPLHPILVAPQLERIFAHRRGVVEEVFGKA